MAAQKQQVRDKTKSKDTTSGRGAKSRLSAAATSRTRDDQSCYQQATNATDPTRFGASKDHKARSTEGLETKGHAGNSLTRKRKSSTGKSNTKRMKQIGNAEEKTEGDVHMTGEIFTAINGEDEEIDARTEHVLQQKDEVVEEEAGYKARKQELWKSTEEIRIRIMGTIQKECGMSAREILPNELADKNTPDLDRSVEWLNRFESLAFYAKNGYGVPGMAMGDLEYSDEILTGECNITVLAFACNLCNAAEDKESSKQRWFKGFGSTLELSENRKRFSKAVGHDYEWLEAYNEWAASVGDPDCPYFPPRECLFRSSPEFDLE